MNESISIRARRIAAFSIILGMTLYLSKFLRDYFSIHHALSFAFGFLPNLGMAFAIPFIYVSNRIRQRKSLKHFGISCLVTLLLMILNEVRDLYQAGRVFDMLDIYASCAGVVLAFIVFQLALKQELPAD